MRPRMVGILFGPHRFAGRLARLCRINLVVEGDPKAIVLNPGDRTTDGSDIAQFDRQAVAAFHAQIAFAHHTAIGEIADTDAMRLARLLNLNAGEQKQAIARYTPGFKIRHYRIISCAQGHHVPVQSFARGIFAPDLSLEIPRHVR